MQQKLGMGEFGWALGTRHLVAVIGKLRKGDQLQERETGDGDS